MVGSGSIGSQHASARPAEGRLVPDGAGPRLIEHARVRAHRQDAAATMRVPRPPVRVRRPPGRQRRGPPGRSDAARRGAPRRDLGRDRVQRAQPPGRGGRRDPARGAGGDLGDVRDTRSGDPAAHWRRNGFETWLSQPAATGRYPAKAPQPMRPVPVLAEPWPGVPVRGRGAAGRAEACWLPIAPGLTPHGLRHAYKDPDGAARHSVDRDGRADGPRGRVGAGPPCARDAGDVAPADGRPDAVVERGARRAAAAQSGLAGGGPRSAATRSAGGVTVNHAGKIVSQSSPKEIDKPPRGWPEAP
jgi:hypothetical protein